MSVQLFAPTEVRNPPEINIGEFDEYPSEKALREARWGDDE